MAIKLPNDFKEFLKLLNENQVRYLLIGGYAVGIHGYPRATGDMDIWIASDVINSERLAHVVRLFGFDLPEVTSECFRKSDTIIRMGMPPLMIELFVDVTGLSFEDCHAKREIKEVDNLEISVIDLNSLIKNKKTVGRHKDLDDIENLI